MFFRKLIPWIMSIAGVLTLTMLYAAISPEAASQQMFGETPSGAFVSIVVPNWGVLIGLMGALLLYGAFHPAARAPALVIAGTSKIAFIALVLQQGERYLAGLQTAVIVDSVFVVLFALCLIVGRGSGPPASRRQAAD
jgi:hypothetical protein